MSPLTEPQLQIGVGASADERGNNKEGEITRTDHVMERAGE